MEEIRKLPESLRFGGETPRVLCLTDLEDALTLLAWLMSEGHVVLTERDRLKDAADAAALEKMGLQVGRVKTTLPDYAAKVRAAVESFVLEHPEVFPEGKRTLKLGTGTIAVKKNPDRVEIKEAEPGGLLKWAANTVAEPAARMLKRLGLAGFWRIKIEPDISGVKKLLDAGKLTPEEGEKAGFVRVPGSDRVEITLGAAKG